MAVVRRRAALGPVLALAAAGCFALKHLVQWSFVNYRVSIKPPSVQLRATYEEDYPNLARVEDMIQESCRVKEGEAEISCLRMYQKLTKFHQSTSQECNLDDLKCIVLDVLERLCVGISGGDGTILLNRVSSVVSSLRAKFSNWDKAFAHFDTDGSGDIDKAEMVAMMAALKTGLTDQEVAICFSAADANDDGVISPEEFSNFMAAAVFAEDTLSAVETDPIPKKMQKTEDFLAWAVKDRDASWASGLPAFR